MNAFLDLLVHSGRKSTDPIDFPTPMPKDLPDFDCGAILVAISKYGLHDFSVERHIDLHGFTAPYTSTNSGAKILHVL